MRAEVQLQPPKPLNFGCSVVYVHGGQMWKCGRNKFRVIPARNCDLDKSSDRVRRACVFANLMFLGFLFISYETTSVSHQ
jgi:hypothetical protein